MYEFWLSKWEIVASTTQWFYTSLGPFIVFPLVVVYVVSRIYGIKFGKQPLLRFLMFLVGILLFANFVTIIDALVAPEKIGFAIGGGKLVVDVGWWGVPSGKVYDISQCQLEWVNGTAVSIWKVGSGGPVVAGKITLRPLGISGYGMVVRGAEWILVARCPDMTYILGAPGLSPGAVHD